jgi:hypothetical protein
MTRNRKREAQAAGRALDLLRDGKKTVLAVSLLVVMAVMWIRVLVGHRPGSAAAAVEQPAATATGTTEAVGPRITMVPLPRVSGRNDGIGRDCFSMRDRAPFGQVAAAPETSTDPEVPSETTHHDQEVVQQIAATLKLDALVCRDGPPRAFVNDRMLEVGDRFIVERGAASLEFEVLRIDENAVLVECNDVQLTLELAQSVEVRTESKSL